MDAAEWTIAVSRQVAGHQRPTVSARVTLRHQLFFSRFAGLSARKGIQHEFRFLPTRTTLPCPNKHNHVEIFLILDTDGQRILP